MYFIYTKRAPTLANKKPAYGRGENLYININKYMRILHQIFICGNKSIENSNKFYYEKRNPCQADDSLLQQI